MKFDTASESPKLFFKAMRWLTDDEFAEATKQGATAEAKKAITMDAAGMDMGKPADALKGAAPKARPMGEMMDEDEEAAIAAERAKLTKAKAKAKPAPVEAEEDDEEPVVKKAAAAKPTAVPGTKALADVVADWDDE
jgi:hypothetical protein